MNCGRPKRAISAHHASPTMASKTPAEGSGAPCRETAAISTTNASTPEVAAHIVSTTVSGQPSNLRADPRRRDQTSPAVKIAAAIQARDTSGRIQRSSTAAR